MHKSNRLPRDSLSDTGNRTDGKEENRGVENQNLDQDGDQFLRHNLRPAQGMSQQQLRGAVPFLSGQRSDAQKRRKQRAADAENISAFNAIEARQGSEVQRFHAESLCKGAHGGKHRGDAVHLIFHFRKNRQADDQEHRDGTGPDQQGFPAPPKLMQDQCHACSPPFP